MENGIIDIEVLKSKLNLSDNQIKDLSDVFEIYMKKYEIMAGKDMHPYFSGVVDGLNTCYKIINGIDDDYNSKIGS